MIVKTYKCDVCEKEVRPDEDKAFRLRWRMDGFELVGLIHSEASEQIVCKDCCRCISRQAAKFTEAS